MRGISIAEGDILALSISKFFFVSTSASSTQLTQHLIGLITELLQGRYALPVARDPSGILAQHEAQIFTSKRAVMASSPSSRSDTTNRLILPHCQPLVEAIGHRMAYEAAVSAGVSQDLIDMYLVNVVKLDAGWYVEHLGMTGKQIEEMECSAVDRLVGTDGGKRLEALVEAFGVEEYVKAPIVSDEMWTAFVDGLPVSEGDAEVQVWPGNGGREREMEMVQAHL